jgi:hypothetical protein
MLGPDDLQDNLIDAALGANVQPRDTALLREVVLSQTVGVIRFRRRLRKCVLAVSLAGCYVAGLATTLALRRPAEYGTPLPSAVSSSLPKPSGPPNSEGGFTKLARVEIVRRDADRCLLERGDVKEAVRHYDHFLKLASADQRAISPKQDSWLLMALKDARSKETTHDRGKQD